MTETLIEKLEKLKCVDDIDDIENHAYNSAIEDAINEVRQHEAAQPQDVQDLLRDMRMQVVWSDKATMPIPLYERMKAMIAAMGDASTRKGEVSVDKTSTDEKHLSDVSASPALIGLIKEELDSTIHLAAHTSEPGLCYVDGLMVAIAIVRKHEALRQYQADISVGQAKQPPELSSALIDCKEAYQKYMDANFNTKNQYLNGVVWEAFNAGWEAANHGK